MASPVSESQQDILKKAWLEGRAGEDSYVFLRLLVDGGVRCGVSPSKGALQDLTLAGYPRPCGGVSDWYPVGIRGYPGMSGIPNV